MCCNEIAFKGIIKQTFNKLPKHREYSPIPIVVDKDPNEQFAPLNYLLNNKINVIILNYGEDIV